MLKRSRVRESRALKGSSRRSTDGSSASARAIATRWRIPPESSPGRASAQPSRPTRRRRSRARAVRAAASCPATSSGKATLASDVRHGSRRGSWNTRPTRGSGPRTAAPSTSTVPAAAGRSPARTRRRVLLPQPFGPTSATTDRRSISRSIPPSTPTDCPPTAKAKRRPARRIAGAASGASDTGSSTAGRGAPSGADTSAPESTTATTGPGRCASHGRGGRPRWRSTGEGAGGAVCTAPDTRAPEGTADPVAAPPLRGTRHPCGRLCAPCGTRPTLASGSDTLRRRCDRRTASPSLRKGRPS